MWHKYCAYLASSLDLFMTFLHSLNALIEPKNNVILEKNGTYAKKFKIKSSRHRNQIVTFHVASDNIILFIWSKYII